MPLLLFEIWFFLFLAFVLGMFVQWFFCCRGLKAARTDSNAPFEGDVKEVEVNEVEEVPEEPDESHQLSEDWRPKALGGNIDNADELKKIKGIGAVIETTLNELGIYQFEQIATWTEQNIAWVENHLAFPGRIQREDWVEQAKTLANGGETEFAERVTRGEIDYR